MMLTLEYIVNEILSAHNVDKQISDSRGDVSDLDVIKLALRTNINPMQVAYLMADVSDVQTNDIKEIYDGLEALSCKFPVS